MPYMSLMMKRVRRLPHDVHIQKALDTVGFGGFLVFGLEFVAVVPEGYDLLL